MRRGYLWDGLQYEIALMFLGMGSISPLTEESARVLSWRTYWPEKPVRKRRHRLLREKARDE